MTAGLTLRAEGRMPALDGAVSWLNTEPLTPEALRGRVREAILLSLRRGS